MSPGDTERSAQRRAGVAQALFESEAGRHHLGDGHARYSLRFALGVVIRRDEIANVIHGGSHDRYLRAEIDRCVLPPYREEISGWLASIRRRTGDIQPGDDD